MNDADFSPYDSADYLTSKEHIAAYMNAVLEEGGDDPAYIARALGVVARAQNLSQLARDTGMTRQGLDKALSGEGNPTLATMMKVAKALGLQIEFRPAAS